MIPEEYYTSSLNSPFLTMDNVGILPYQYKRTYSELGSVNFAYVLDNCVDLKTKKNTNFYLTPRKKISDLFDGSIVKLKTDKITTYLFQGSKYLYVTDIDTLPYILQDTPRRALNYKVGVFHNTKKTLLTIDFLENELNVCRIYYTDPEKNLKYFLASDADDNVFFINQQILPVYSPDVVAPHDFLYMFSESSNSIVFFKKTETKNLILTKNKNILKLQEYKKKIISQFGISRNLYDTPSKSLNTTYITYNENGIINKNKTVFDLKNNLVFYKNTNEDSTSNIVVLKNQMTELGVFVPVYGKFKNYRDYTAISEDIHTTNHEELSLNYTFEYQTYKITPGTNIFTSPTNIFPYTKLNIKNTDFINQGAFGGPTPEFSDKIYSLSENVTHLNNDQHLLCTWLFRNPNTDEYKWLDRYYYPDLVDKKEALASTPIGAISQYDEYVENLIKVNSKLEESVTNNKFFDVVSKFTISPNTTYRYERIKSMSPADRIIPTCYEINSNYPMNIFKKINEIGKFTLHWYFRGDDNNWVVKSDRNDINCGLTISKTKNSILFRYDIFDPTTQSYKSFNTSTQIKQNKINFIVVSGNSITGQFYFFLNDKIIYEFNLKPYKFVKKRLLYGDFFLYRNNTKNNMLMLPNNYFEQVSLILDNIDKNLLSVFPTIDGYIEIDDLYISIPCGFRNSTDNINLLFQICSNATFKSNHVNIIVKNAGGISKDVKEIIEQTIVKNVKSVLPQNISIKNILFKNYK